VIVERVEHRDEPTILRFELLHALGKLFCGAHRGRDATSKISEQKAGRLALRLVEFFLLPGRKLGMCSSARMARNR
jgi:hypothetical protein